MTFFMITPFIRWYVRVSILLTCWTHFHDSIISRRGEACAYKTSLIQPLLIYWRRVGVEKWFSCCLKTVCFVSITHFGSPNGALSERRIQVMWCTQCFMHNNYDWSETLYRDGTKWHWISYSIKTYIGFLYFGHYVICSFSIYGFWLPIWYHQTRLVPTGNVPPVLITSDW